MKNEFKIQESQKRAILNHMKEGGTITSLGARRQFGTCYLPARIADIKKMGVVEVKDKWIKARTRYGYKRVKTVFNLRLWKDISQQIADKKKMGTGWPMAFVSGNSQTDNKDWSIEILNHHADEVPIECADAATFSQLVAGLLNYYYNDLETKDVPVEKIIRMGKPLAELKIPHPDNPELPF